MKKKKRKWVKVLLIIGSVIVALIIAAIIFLTFWKPFGGKASQEDKENYASRATNYDGKIFHNEHDFDLLADVDDNADDGVISDKGVVPEDAIPIIKPEYNDKLSVSDLQITWFGHSSLMIQIHSMNILVDPVFSDRSSPVSFVGSKRFSEVPISAEDLPELDVVIISHDHYDHLDYNTIKKIDSKVKKYIVPLGVENHLERWGISKDKIQNMAWWEETNVDGLTIACTPAKHYSGRSINDSYNTLWASWVLKDEYHQIFESGDTGYDNHFEEIVEKYGKFDLALMDCSQYDLRWPNVHMNPEESFKAAKTLQADYVMPIHWSTFALANHPWDDPVERYIEAAKNDTMTVITPLIGEIVRGDQLDSYQEHWWENVK